MADMLFPSVKALLGSFLLPRGGLRQVHGPVIWLAG